MHRFTPKFIFIIVDRVFPYILALNPAEGPWALQVRHQDSVGITTLVSTSHNHLLKCHDCARKVTNVPNTMAAMFVHNREILSKQSSNI